MHECGKLCTKFSVPSTGSIIHVGESVNSHFAPSLVDSSPIKLMREKKRLIKGRKKRQFNIELTDDAGIQRSTY